jgi:hypothetical protein
VALAEGIVFVPALSVPQAAKLLHALGGPAPLTLISLRKRGNR